LSEIKMLDIEIEEMLGKTVPIEKHKEQVEAVARLMITWWDKASENAATKIKDAGILKALREAGDHARREILELT